MKNIWRPKLNDFVKFVANIYVLNIHTFQLC